MIRMTACCLALTAFVAAPLVQAGGATEQHPCYEVADCKTKDSREEFSACIKANKAEADANAACAEFRGDKDAYLNKHGISGIDSLFGS